MSDNDNDNSTTLDKYIFYNQQQQQQQQQSPATAELTMMTAEERVKKLSVLYGRAREKIRASGGMLTNEQALKAVLEEDRQRARDVLEDLIAKEEDEYNRAVFESWRSLPVEHVIYAMEKSIANILKEVRKTDPGYALWKYDHHKDNPAEFDQMLQELKEKGLI